ncbi:MAG: acyltransferase [Thermodesulfobacteriota bacterium]
MKKTFIKLLKGAAFILLLPFFIWSKLPFSEYSSFTAPSQILSLIPGLSGILLRRVWYENTLKSCGRKLTVDWLAAIRTRDSEIGNNCTLGVANWVGWILMGDDVIMGSRVVLSSGGRQHSFSDLRVPIRLQQGAKRQLKIGSNIWIGAHSVILADISSGTVVGAGSIVTKTYSENAVIAGNPARILYMRS